MNLLHMKLLRADNSRNYRFLVVETLKTSQLQLWQRQFVKKIHIRTICSVNYAKFSGENPIIPNLSKTEDDYAVEVEYHLQLSPIRAKKLLGMNNIMIVVVRTVDHI